MKCDPQKHYRRSIRLKNYDYSQAGAYYVTINVQNRDYLFGEIVNYEMILNAAGKMIEEQWLALLERFSNIELDVYQVMPNHSHGIILIVESELGVKPTAGTSPVPMRIIGYKKSDVTTTSDFLLFSQSRSFLFNHTLFQLLEQRTWLIQLLSRFQLTGFPL